MLEIKEVYIRKIETNGEAIAYADIVTSENLRLNNILLLEKNDGERYILMSRKKVNKENGERTYYEFFPIDNETREIMLDAISDEYNKEIEE